MTATRDATIAARIPVDLRDELEAEVAARRARGETRPDGAPVDLSTVVRVALRRHVDAGDEHGSLGGLFASTAGKVHPSAAKPVTELADGAAAAVKRTRYGTLENGAPGAARRSDPPTSKLAALRVAARAGSQRRRALEMFEAAGEGGLTADNVAAGLAPLPHNGVARRVTDLLQGGLIEPQPHELPEPRAHGIPATRRTRAGAQATIYRITGDGLLALTAKRKAENAR